MISVTSAAMALFLLLQCRDQERRATSVRSSPHWLGGYDALVRHVSGGEVLTGYASLLAF
jgi:hypothetical protein